jgi:hypothetical protein
MKNFKQIAFGLLVGALALGFSSFTNAKRSGTYLFVHTVHSTSNTKADYTFVTDPNDCSFSSSDICTAQWMQSAAPAPGSSPAADATQVSGSIDRGDYNN